MHNTLKKKKDFQRVFKKGKRVSSLTVHMTYFLTNEKTQLAFVAGKKIGNAITRNRCKRLLRVAAQVNKNNLPKGDIIFFATPQTKTVKAEQVIFDIKQLLKKVMS